ncbi:MAG: hypothetical protein LBE17_10060 [Treponema sp.]|nr:hypothetical protein [Treponema sp.]
MIPETVPPIIGFFSDIKDPRIGRTKCYPLIEVIPKHDAYRQVFNRLNHRDIERCFMAWVRTIKQEKDRDAADLTSDAIDGKTPRGRFNTRQGSKAIHLAGARATENRLAFALVKTGSTLRNLLRPPLENF